MVRIQLGDALPSIQEHAPFVRAVLYPVVHHSFGTTAMRLRVRFHAPFLPVSVNRKSAHLSFNMA